MNTPLLRLTVYNRSDSIPRFRWPSDEGKEPKFPERADADEWYDALYSWELGGGEQVASILQHQLSSEFCEGKPPGERGPKHLKEVVESLRKDVKEEWCSSLIEDEDMPIMTNPSIALVEYLCWIAETFAHLPGAHIVVR